MNDLNYCVETLPKVSRTFALNISALKGDLHKNILVAYLFCRTIDTVEDASKLGVANKVRLLLDFASLLKNTENRKIALDQWVKDISIVDGNEADTIVVILFLSLSDKSGNTSLSLIKLFIVIITISFF